jgi:hypothetical protein
MSKLTHGDVETLRTFFSSPLTAGYRACIAAQSYEPRGPGYDPSTDAKLARLVFDGVRLGKSEWAQTKRVLDNLSDAHVEVLHLVVAGGSDAIARRMPEALAAGRRLRGAEARARALHDAMSTRDGASPMTIAQRVIETDRTFQFRADHMSVLQAQAAAHDAIAAGLVDVSVPVAALVEEVIGAYHAARALAGAWKADRARREDDRRATFRAELADRRASKEAARFDRRLLPKAS